MCNDKEKFCVINQDFVASTINEVTKDQEQKKLRIEEKQEKFKRIQSNGARLTKHRFTL